jgi:alpha-aminoadipate carrier protein LysW
MVTCPECKVPIDLDEDELDEGDLVTCDDCGAELRVLSLDPIELESADDEDEEEEDLELDEGDDEEHWR